MRCIQEGQRIPEGSLIILPPRDPEAARLADQAWDDFEASLPHRPLPPIASVAYVSANSHVGKTSFDRVGAP